MTGLGQQLLLTISPCFARLRRSSMRSSRVTARPRLPSSSRRVDVNAPEPDGTTALHWAVHQNDLDLVERLIRAGANVNAKNDYGSTPMSEAAIVGNAAMIERLLKAGADASRQMPMARRR